MLQKILFIICFFLNLAHGWAEISINSDQEDCIDGWFTMDVDVTIGEEVFNFDPACESSFHRNFITKLGVSCAIEAGMCSSFEPKNTFSVVCKDGSKNKINIGCPQ